jgi:hypothetical protein
VTELERRCQPSGGGKGLALELCVLAAFAALAAHLAMPSLVRVLLGTLFCAVGGAVWGLFLSPKRKYEIGTGGRLLLEAVYFVGAAMILDFNGYSTLALALVVMAAADRISLALIP